MIEVNTNHCQIVEESLNGEKAVDEQTFASLAILTERLERLKNSIRFFPALRFHPLLENLESRRLW